MTQVTDFIDQVLNQDFASAAPTFKDIMGDVMNQSLEQEKIKLADQMFNGVAPAQTEPDQYEIDLEDLDAAAEEALDLDDDDAE